MNEENTRKLFEDFPRLYRGREFGLMQFGFECDDGWFDLIHKLSSDIEQSAFEAGLEQTSEQWPRATQVKEKCGSLRFHFHIRSQGEDDHGPVLSLLPKNGLEPRLAKCVALIRELIAKALEDSTAICEQCGKKSCPRNCTETEIVSRN